MRLHRVRLHNYRGVDDCEVEFSIEGVTVVEGPNEVGKTCIPQGLDLLRTRLDSSKHRQVMSTQPVGRDVGPEVEVEMSTGEYRLVYRKRWIRRPETTLEVIEPAHEQLRGREAHERVEEILDETLENRDLWEALRIEQGTELALPSFNLPPLTSALDLASGGADATAEDDDLWTRICELRDRYWTTTGRPKQDRTRRQAGLDEARATLAELEQQLAGMDRDVNQLSRLAGEAERLARTSDDCDRQARSLSEDWDAAEKLRAAVELRDAHLDEARAKHDRAAADQKRRAELIDASAEAADQLSAVEEHANQAAPAVAAAVRRVEEARNAAETVREALKAAQTEQRRADEDRDHHRRRIEVEQLSERYERVVEAEQRLKAADELLASALVDEELLEQIEQAHIAVVQADAAVASVETTALRDLLVRIDGEDATLAADETRSTVVAEDAILEIPGTVRVRVRPGAGARSLAEERRNAREELRRLCQSGGVADLSQARAADEQRKEAQRDRDDAIETINRDVRDLTVDALRSKVEGLTGRIDSYAASRPADPPLPSDYEEAKRLAAERGRAVDDLQQEYGTRRQAVETSNDTLQQQQNIESRLSGKLEGALAASQEAARRLSDARSQRSDDEIEASLAESAQRIHDAQLSVRAAESELQAADPESLEIRLRNARAAAKRARSDLQSNQTRQDELRFDLEVRGEQGLHTSRDEAESRLRHLEHEHEGIEARAKAARLLHDTFLRRRQESTQRYVGLFKERIERSGRVVFGPSFAVEIDDQLRVASRTLDGDTLEVDQLSTGALEQIGVISRLACAAIVSPDGGGAPVIIDDALGWSDPERLECMGAAIAAAGSQCQVIILTCTPGRYAHIGNATTVRLPSAP